MPSSPRTPVAAPCWNCERRAADAVAVTLRTPSGGEATLPLCRRCYDEDYVPLVARMEAAGHEGATLTLRTGRSGPVGAQ